MTMPPANDIELPLLKVIEEAGGVLDSSVAAQTVTKYYPELTKEDLASKLDSGGLRWPNRVQWARQYLVNKGDLTPPSRRTWSISGQGRERLKREFPTWRPRYSTRIDPLSVGSEAVEHPRLPGAPPLEPSSANPQEELEASRRKIVEAVELEVLRRVKELSPS